MNFKFRVCFEFSVGLDERVNVGLVSFAVLAASVSGVGRVAASPSCLTGPSITVPWDDSNSRLPARGCTQCALNRAMGNANFLTEATLLSQFGDETSVSVMACNLLGSRTAQQCNPNDAGVDMQFTTRLNTDRDSMNGDGSSQVLEAPVAFHTRAPAAAYVTSLASFKCIKKLTFKKQTFIGRSMCPTGSLWSWSTGGSAPGSL